jgi:hypothetical protein
MLWSLAYEIESQRFSQPACVDKYRRARISRRHLHWKRNGPPFHARKCKAVFPVESENIFTVDSKQLLPRMWEI